MLGYRSVRTADIPKDHRDLFERYGETVIQLTITSGHNPASTDLVPVYNDYHHARSHAEAWLSEMGDRRANKEWRLEFVDWAILIFVIVGVFADFSLAFHWFDPK
jgi:hypothetical protein